MINATEDLIGNVIISYNLILLTARTFSFFKMIKYTNYSKLNVNFVKILDKILGT